MTSQSCEEYKGRPQVVYKRYASLYFVMGIDTGDNELLTLETIHHYVEVLDRYFGNVCELDLIFNFHKAGALLVPPASQEMTRCRSLQPWQVQRDVVLGQAIRRPQMGPMRWAAAVLHLESGSCSAERPHVLCLCIHHRRTSSWTRCS